ncbi:MAG TPA: recombinase family protein [Pseudonocardiaceae bacterium]
MHWFSEKISTRIKIRPELEKALTLAHEIKTAAPDQPVILTVHEMKRLARNAAELMSLSAQLQGGGMQLELLTGPLTGIYDPHGMGAMLFAVLAVAAQLSVISTRRGAEVPGPGGCCLME